MRKLLALMVVASLVVVASCQKEETVEPVQDEIASENLVSDINGTVIPGQYIVVLNETKTGLKSASTASYDERLAEVRSLANSMVRTKSTDEYEVDLAFAEVVKGFSVRMSDRVLQQLQNDDRVKYIEQDMHIMRPPWEDGGGEDPVGEEVPYGIERVGYGNGTGKVAWIIDSGIDLDHADLNVDASRGFTAFTKGPDSKSADDRNGHGTHCAGTVAAIDNEIGVIGIAAGATVVPVKVLDSRGSGSTSGVIAGIDYVAANASPGDAANMSLGGGVSETLDNAVIAASENGIYFALAAGNESDNAANHSPARANGQYIWTISAMDSNDYWASFSNYGNPPVDFCEPGVDIKSTWKDGGYNTISGTSMASPHMCGILLMTNGNPNTDGYVSGDPDGNADAIGTL